MFHLWKTGIAFPSMATSAKSGDKGASRTPVAVSAHWGCLMLHAQCANKARSSLVHLPFIARVWSQLLFVSAGKKIFYQFNVMVSLDSRLAGDHKYKTWGMGNARTRECPITTWSTGQGCLLCGKHLRRFCFFSELNQGNTK